MHFNRLPALSISPLPEKREIIMVRNNTQLENSIIFIDIKLNRLLHTRKVIEGILNDLNDNQRGPVSSSDTAHTPAPSLHTNFPEVPPFAEPMATGSGGVVPAAAFSESFSPLQAERGLGDLPPLCSFGQGDFTRCFTPAGDKGIITKFCRLLRRLWQAVLFQVFEPAPHADKKATRLRSMPTDGCKKRGRFLKSK